MFSVHFICIIRYVKFNVVYYMFNIFTVVVDNVCLCLLNMSILFMCMNFITGERELGIVAHWVTLKIELTFSAATTACRLTVIRAFTCTAHVLVIFRDINLNDVNLCPSCWKERRSILLKVDDAMRDTTDD